MGTEGEALQGVTGIREVELTDVELLAAHDVLLARDHLLGLEAAVASLKVRVRTLRIRNKRLRGKLEDAVRDRSPSASSTSTGRLASLLRRRHR